MNWRSRRSRYSRFSEVFLNDTGKLDEERAQPSFAGEGVEAFAGAGFVFVGGANGGGGSGLHHGDGRVGEGAIEFGGEKKFRIHRRDLAAPELGQFRLQRSVKRGIDFGGVEEARQIFQRMPCGAACPGDKDSLPVFVRPSSRADADVFFMNLRRTNWG